MFHYVYVITNTVNGKIYVGKHSTENLDDGYMGSGTAIKRAREKYGYENFKKTILEICDSEDDAYVLESLIVNEEFLKRDDVYNHKLGGEGLSSKNARVISEFAWSSPSIRERMMASLRRNNEVNWANPNFKRTQSEKQKNAWKGRRDRVESVSRAVSKKQTGSGNSQYGKVWVYHTDLQISKRVAIQELDEMLRSGWYKGRKIKWLVPRKVP